MINGLRIRQALHCVHFSVSTALLVFAAQSVFAAEGVGATPQNLQVLGSLPGTANAVAVSGSVAVLAAGEAGLRIVSVANPGLPAQVGSYDTPGTALSVAISGSIVVVADGPAGFQFIDISNPALPSPRGNYPAAAGDGALVVRVSGTLAFTGSEGGTMRIIDFSNPDLPTFVGQTPEASGGAKGVTVHGSFAFIAAPNLENPSYPSMFLSYRVDDPSIPVLRGNNQSPPPDNYLGAAATDGLACVAHGNSGLYVLEYNDLNGFNYTNQIDTPGVATSVAISSALAFVADGPGGVQVIDISHIDALQSVGSYDTAGQGLEVAVSGATAYVADGSAGLAILQFTGAVPTLIPSPTPPATPTPQNVILLGSLGGAAASVAVEGSMAVLTDGANGIRLVNVANPNAPGEVGDHDTPGIAYDVAITNSTACVADGSSVQFIDITNPTSPFHVSDLPMPPTDIARHVSVMDHLVAVGISRLPYSGAFLIVDISNRSVPIILATIPTEFLNGIALSPSRTSITTERNNGLIELHKISAFSITNPALPAFRGSSLEITATGAGELLGIAATDFAAYAANGPAGLRVFDAADPSNLNHGYVADTPGSARNVALSGELAFVADGGGGLAVVDVSDVKAPARVGLFNTGGEGLDVAVQGNTVYLADGAQGLAVLQFTGAAPINGRSVGDTDNSGCTDVADFLKLIDHWRDPNYGNYGVGDFLSLLDHWHGGPNCA